MTLSDVIACIEDPAAIKRILENLINTAGTTAHTLEPKPGAIG